MDAIDSQDYFIASKDSKSCDTGTHGSGIGMMAIGLKNRYGQKIIQVIPREWSRVNSRIWLETVAILVGGYGKLSSHVQLALLRQASKGRL